MDDKYHILHDYGAYEGNEFYDEKQFDSVEEAVKFAVGLNYATRFRIVKIVWEP